MKERAEDESFDTFRRNLKKKLLSQPLRLRGPKPQRPRLPGYILIGVQNLNRCQPFLVWIRPSEQVVAWLHGRAPLVFKRYARGHLSCHRNFAAEFSTKMHSEHWHGPSCKSNGQLQVSVSAERRTEQVCGGQARHKIEGLIGKSSQTLHVALFLYARRRAPLGAVAAMRLLTLLHRDPRSGPQHSSNAERTRA